MASEAVEVQSLGLAALSGLALVALARGHVAKKADQPAGPRSDEIRRFPETKEELKVVKKAFTKLDFYGKQLVTVTL